MKMVEAAIAFSPHFTNPEPVLLTVLWHMQFIISAYDTELAMFHLCYHVKMHLAKRMPSVDIIVHCRIEHLHNLGYKLRNTLKFHRCTLVCIIPAR